MFTYSYEFEQILDGLSDALDFSRTIGAAAVTPYERGGGRNTLGEVDFYTRCVLWSFSFVRMQLLNAIPTFCLFLVTKA